MKWLLSLFVMAWLFGCSNPCTTASSVVKKELLGKSKRDVLRCMGRPLSNDDISGMEVWTYQAGSTKDKLPLASTGFASSQFKIKDKPSLHFECKMHINFERGQVSAVNFVGHSGASSACYYLIENCLPLASRLPAWKTTTCSQYY